MYNNHYIYIYIYIYDYITIIDTLSTVHVTSYDTYYYYYDYYCYVYYYRIVVITVSIVIIVIAAIIVIAVTPFGSSHRLLLLLLLWLYNQYVIVGFSCCYCTLVRRNYITFVCIYIYIYTQLYNNYVYPFGSSHY